jgi:hypothetical protein
MGTTTTPDEIPPVPQQNGRFNRAAVLIFKPQGNQMTMTLVPTLTRP